MSITTTDVSIAPGLRRLFSPLKFRSFTVRNRIVNTVHSTSLPPDRNLEYLRARARGGVGLMGISAGRGVLEYVPGVHSSSRASAWDVTPMSPLSDEGIAFYDAEVIPNLAASADVIHAEGAHCFGQVVHAGAALPWTVLRPLVGPSGLRDPEHGISAVPLSRDHIAELVHVFAHGIRRIHEAGLDGAELHGAHGYLLNAFLSPYSNRRDDEYGGDAMGRARFATEIVAAARAMVGDDFDIGIRVGIDADGVKRGLTTSDLVEVCKALAPHVDYISVSGGNHTGLGVGREQAYVEPYMVEQGFNAPFAAAVKAAVDVPVFVTGRFVDPSVAESILRDGVADMVGMVRALIADPDLPAKARSGRSLDVRPCLALSECHHVGSHRTPVTCAMNAAAGREREMEIHPADEPKSVAVIGAGPAGLEAARVA
ncbi:MAG: hypothetical protein ABWX92_06195, partial [Mycetocola sp.]